MNRRIVALLWALFLACVSAVLSSPTAGSIRVSNSVSGLDLLQSDFEKFAVRSSRRRPRGRSLQAGDPVASCHPWEIVCGKTGYTYCTNATSDVYNCGACGVTCAKLQYCCNSICTDINTDPDNCGACGSVCSGLGICSNGVCNYGI
jgi:hypothetical protein